jgi:hypothetical protein
VTPTLAGRLQTRIVLLFGVGVAWTLIIGPLVAAIAGMSYGTAINAGIRALMLVVIAGVVWELVYHALQQIRWEKDWPTLFGLATGITEGALVWVLLEVGVAGDAIPFDAFVVHFTTTWVLIWAIANGPLTIIAPRWRYRGGRFW